MESNVRVEVRRAGQVVDAREVHNLVTSAGLAWLTRLVGSEGTTRHLSHCGFGGGATAVSHGPSAGDTGLRKEYEALRVRGAESYLASGEGAGAGEMTLVFYLPAGPAAVTERVPAETRVPSSDFDINEVGLFTGAVSEMARAAFVASDRAFRASDFVDSGGVLAAAGAQSTYVEGGSPSLGIPLPYPSDWTSGMRYIGLWVPAEAGEITKISTANESLAGVDSGFYYNAQGARVETDKDSAPQGFQVQASPLSQTPITLSGQSAVGRVWRSTRPRPPVLRGGKWFVGNPEGIAGVRAAADTASTSPDDPIDSTRYTSASGSNGLVDLPAWTPANEDAWLYFWVPEAASPPLVIRPAGDLEADFRREGGLELGPPGELVGGSVWRSRVAWPLSVQGTVWNLSASLLYARALLNPALTKTVKDAVSVVWAMRFSRPGG